MKAANGADGARVTLAGLQTWVINLDRATDRLARISQQLGALGLRWQRLSAVDARQLTAQQQAALDAPGFHRRHGMTPLPGELGCYLSHLEVMRAFVASPDSQTTHALILEDDVLLKPTLPAVLAALLQHPQRWDVAKLSAVHSGTPVAYLPLAAGHHLAVMLSKCTGSSAYVLNRAAAHRYLAGLLPMQLPYDHVFDQGWRFGLRFRLVTPTPCGHDEGIASTIGTPADAPNRKFPWQRRLPTYAFRLGNELRRLGYGVREVVREKLSD